MPDGEPLVLCDLADGVLTVTLNRPERSNGWTGALTRAYFGALEQAARSPEVRAIVVTGAGRAFSIGGDGALLGDIAGSGAGTPVDPDPAPPAWFPLRVAKPVVAAINGACFGMGLQQALCCDVRFAADDAKFCTAYARRGVPSELGIGWLLPRVVGMGHAMDLLLSARLVRAPEAERIGLVNRVVPAATLVAEAQAYAGEIARTCSPTAMRTMKAQMLRDLDGSFADAFARSEVLLDEAFRSADFREGIASWQESRAPAFAPVPPELGLLDE